MNLTKDELYFLLESIDALSEKGSYQAEELAENAYSALYHDELEIEGYEKVEWVKFDQNDPKTYPAESGDYIVYLLDEGYPMPVYAAWFNDSHKFSATLPVSHWRKMPLPPVKK